MSNSGTWQTTALNKSGRCGSGAPTTRPPLLAPWGAALDRELVLRRVLLIDEPLHGGEEVVEDVLLLGEHAGLVPALAVLAAAAQVGDGEHAAALQEQEAARVERWRQCDVEAAVAGQQRRVLPVLLDPLLVRQEHRDRRLVLRRIRHLLDGVLVE